MSRTILQIKVPVPSFDAKTKTMIGADKRKVCVGDSLVCQCTLCRAW